MDTKNPYIKPSSPTAHLVAFTQDICWLVGWLVEFVGFIWLGKVQPNYVVLRLHSLHDELTLFEKKQPIFRRRSCRVLDQLFPLDWFPRATNKYEM